MGAGKVGAGKEEAGKGEAGKVETGGAGKGEQGRGKQGRWEQERWEQGRWKQEEQGKRGHRESCPITNFHKMPHTSFRRFTKKRQGEKQILKTFPINDIINADDGSKP